MSNNNDNTDDDERKQKLINTVSFISSINGFIYAIIGISQLVHASNRYNWDCIPNDDGQFSDIKDTYPKHSVITKSQNNLVMAFYFMSAMINSILSLIKFDNITYKAICKYHTFVIGGLNSMAVATSFPEKQIIGCDDSKTFYFFSFIGQIALIGIPIFLYITFCMVHTGNGVVVMIGWFLRLMCVLTYPALVIISVVARFKNMGVIASDFFSYFDIMLQSIKLILEPAFFLIIVNKLLIREDDKESQLENYIRQ